MIQTCSLEGDTVAFLKESSAKNFIRGEFLRPTRGFTVSDGWLSHVRWGNETVHLCESFELQGCAASMAPHHYGGWLVQNRLL